MKKLSLILIAFLLFPAMLSAQYKVKAIHQEPVDLKVTIPGYNNNLPAAVMNVTFEFDQETETLLVRMNKGQTNCEFDKIWLPQHPVTVAEMETYMKSRDIKLRKAQSFKDQENFLNLSSRTLAASIESKGMTFNGVYDLKSKRKVRRQLDHQMVPLDGKMELDLTFNTDKKTKVATLTLHNPIPMNRSGRRGTVAYVADDVTIDVELGRCKNAEQNIITIKEYEAMFRVAEDKLNDLRKSPTTQKAYAEFALNMAKEIDLERFEAMTCDEIQYSYENLAESIEHIEQIAHPKNKPSTSTEPSSDGGCNVKALNEEIKTNTTKLNNLVNEWSLASDAAAKAEKKAAFDALVQRTDAKINGLSASCKKQLDSKLLKNYEFVKKLVK